MNKIVVSIVALLVAVVVLSASLPIFGSVSMETATAENTGGGELNYILVDSHRQFSFSLDEVNDVLTVTNGTDKQTITNTDNFLYADSNFSITVSSAGAVDLFGKNSDNQIVSASLNDLPVTVARIDGGVSVTSGVNTYLFGNPIYAYIPLSTGGYVSFPNDTDVTIDSSVKDAFIGSYAGTTAYNGMNTGNYNLVLQKDINGNVLSGGQWVSGTSDNTDELLNIEPLDIDPIQPLNPGNSIKSVPNPHFWDGDWGYNEIDSNNARIVAYRGSAGDLTIPTTAGGYTITELGKGGSNNVFQTSLNPFTITVPSGISINAGAFYGCTGLTSVTISEGVTSIGSNAFYGCTGLTSVTIPSTITEISVSAFESCTGLTSVTIPSSVTSIGTNAFISCSNLSSLTLNEGLLSIGSYAFSSSGLSTVTIPSSVTSLQSTSFKSSPNLTEINVTSGNLNYSSINGVLFNDDQTVLITYPAGKSGVYEIPNTVTVISPYSFQKSIISSVTIPSSVTSIGTNAFDGCTALTSVSIPSSVTSIGNYTFQGCTALTSVSIPSSVTSIGNSAFKGCTVLTSVTIPSGVTTIGNNAFQNSGVAYVLNLSDLELTGTSYGLNNAEISDNIPVYLFIANSEYITMAQKDGAVNTLLSMLPLIAVLGLIIGAIAVMLIRRV